MKARAALLLLADSQLLFRPEQVTQPMPHFDRRTVQAAYVGAANGHQQGFFELACAGLDALFGQSVPCAFVRGVEQIPARPVNLLILAGGNVSLGWAFLRHPAVRTWVSGVLENPAALVIGVSAGAIHLARGCDPELPNPVAQVYLDAFPHFVAVHEERQGWPSRQVWRQAGGQGEFVPIPMGGGLWVQGEDRIGIGNASA